MTKFGNLPTYTVSQLEERARRILIDSFGQDPMIPVEIEIILETLPGVTLDIWPALRPNYSTEGAVCRDVDTGGLFVFIDDSLADNSPTRYRMTVAEELGHIILHRSIIDQVTSVKDFVELQRHPQWREIDRNAKRFAAATLMPGAQLIEHAQELYPRFVDVAGFGNVNAVLSQLVAKLAQRFEVSPQSMRHRIGEWPMKLADRVTRAMQDGLHHLE